MSGWKILAIALILSGVLGLAYGGFSYTKEAQEARSDPLELTVEERQAAIIWF
ncbi:hypothetical protein ABC977_16245 [Thioalkalicoccus limnaeus]|uniref:Uncharacterized protein n=1 Tax=Thioalkalicoccus limnaeus TaxID=120681 RepID=A0ABV4BHF9_9GAMM